MSQPRYQLTDNDSPVVFHKQRSTFFVFLVCLNAALSSFYVGYSLVYISTIQQFSTIIQIYNINLGPQDVTQSIVTGCVPVGAIFGALSSSIFLKKFSRKNCFLVNNGLAIISMGIILVKIAPMILIGRLLQGFCTGIFSAIVPLYINQFVPLSLKKFGTMNQVLISTAQSFVFFFYWLLTDPITMSDEESWNFVSNFLLITIAVQSLVFIFVYPYETPKYWIVNQQPQKCKQLLRIIYVQQYVEETFNQIQTYEMETIIIPQQPQIADTSSRNSELMVKDVPRMCKLAVFLAIHVALYQQLTGVNSVALYGGKIVNDVLPDLNKVIPIFTNMLPGIAAAFATTLMKKYGRKTLLQLGGILVIIPLIIMSSGFIAEAHTDSIVPKVMIVISLFLYMGGFGLTLGPIVWLYIPEIVEPHIIPYSTMANLIGAAICIIIFPIASAQLPNKAYLFAIFLVWGIVAMIINQRYLVETKDKSKQQIYREQKTIQRKYFNSDT